MNISEQKDEHIVFEDAESQILHRPGMWIGSRKSTLRELAVFENGQFETNEFEIIPAVAKLVEEVAVNSADEHVRTKNIKLRGWTLDTIKITLNNKGLLTVYDNGGITSVLHSTGLYPVEVIFGKLFSSSNYDDSVTRATVGTNGVGASLTNLFSKRFKVTSADAKKKITVEWFDNKARKSEAIVEDCKEHYTQIEAELDLERFDLETINYGIMKYVERLSLLLAASNPGLRVHFNEEEFYFDSFKQYAELYGFKNMFGEKNESWELYLAPTYGQEAKRYAVVNGAECNSGSHIKHLEMLMRWHIGEMLKREKIDNVTAQMIGSSYHVIMNITVDKPEYADQAKTELTSDIYHIDKKGEKTNLVRSEAFRKQIENGPIADWIKELSKEREAALNSKEINKKAKELKGKSAKTVKKLIDAGESSRAKRKYCELWIFEGASAGAGFRTGRCDADKQGSYLLKGKCKNSINMSTLAVMSNQEFSDIIIALGLDPRKPNDLSGLRYGRINIATDMDYDGHSIFGQIITMFAVHFPKVIESGMIHRAISPIYRAKKNKDVKYFYSYEEFDKWSESKASAGYKIKYFKGLGSLEPTDYSTMLTDSRLEKIQLDEEGIELMHAFLGKDSAPRKKLLAANV